MKSVIIVVFLAVAAYFLFRPTTFVVSNDIFMYKSQEDVYEFMSDLKRTIEKHSSTGGKCSLLKQRKRKDGVREKLYLVEKVIPLFRDYELPFNMEVRLTLSKPNEELLYNYGILRGYLLKLQGKMTFEVREGRAMQGTFLTEELTVTCPWLAQMFVEKQLKESHKDTLISLRNGLESLYVPKDKVTEAEGGTEGRAQRDKKTEQEKEAAGTEKERAATRDEAKKASKEERKAAKTSGQEKKETPKKDERPAKDEKQKTKKSQDAGARPQTVKKEEEEKEAGRKREEAKEGQKEKVESGRDDGGAKEQVKRREEAGKGKEEERRESKAEGKEAKSKAKDEKREQVKADTTSGGKVKTEVASEGSEPKKATKPETGGQKPSQASKAEKIVKPDKAAPKQTAKTGG